MSRRRYKNHWHRRGSWRAPQMCYSFTNPDRLLDDGTIVPGDTWALWSSGGYRRGKR